MANTCYDEYAYQIIGAGAIELAGARAPQFLTAGARGAQQNLWGTCKKIKRLMKKSQIFSKGSVQRVIPSQRTHCDLS